jgi:hypothetical protein
MRGWGVMLLIVGLGSFLLPMAGLQFRLVSIFGEYQTFAAIGMAVAGGLMIAFGGSSESDS